MLLLYHLLALGLRMRGVVGFIFCLIAISLGRLRAPQARCSRFLLFYLIAISLGRPRATKAGCIRFYILSYFYIALLALGRRRRGVVGFIFYLIAISLSGPGRRGRGEVGLYLSYPISLAGPWASQARCSRFYIYLFTISFAGPWSPQTRRSRFYIYLIVISFGGPKAGGSASKCQPGKLGLQINMQKILESRLLRNKAQKKIGRKCPMPERG